MPAFDLKYIKIGYAEPQGNGTIKYRQAKLLGDAITVNMELRFAEARAWAESNIAAALRRVIGGTISIGVDQINEDAYASISDMFRSSRTPIPDEEAIIGHTVRMSSGAIAAGLGFYAPDMMDGVEKYCCVFAPWVQIYSPTQGFNTLGENVTFSTPTLTGEFMPAPLAGHPLFETGIADSEYRAISWIDKLLGTYS